MKEIKIKFVDFWPTFDANDNNFVRALCRRHQVVVLPSDSDEKPDILFYSCFGNRHYDYDCVKIYFTGENDFPDLNECDYSISFYDYSCGGRNIRYPLYMFYEVEQAAASHLSMTDEQALSRDFCSLVMGNATTCDPRRLEIIDRIQDYKPLAYGGRFRNNVGGPVAEKIPFIANYKFNLALENSMMPGYVTEKIVEPFAAATVPIYWGDDAVKSDFNPESYICVNDFDDFDNLLAYVRYLDTHPDEYLKMLRAANGVVETVELLNNRLEEFLCKIADNPVRQISNYGMIATHNRQNSVLRPLANSRLLFGLAKLLIRK